MMTRSLTCWTASNMRLGRTRHDWAFFVELRGRAAQTPRSQLQFAKEDMFLLPLIFGLCFSHCQDIPPDTLITLEHTECYGECPSYELTIRADGTVVFVGRRF